MLQKRVLCPALCLLSLLCLLAGCASKSEMAGEPKNITVVVTHKDGSVLTKEDEVTSENLTQALLELGLLAPGSGDNGYYTTVDGETANTDAREWWYLSIDGEMSMTGFDSTPVVDGTSYEITFTQGW